MSPRPGRILEIIENKSRLPIADWTFAIRPSFLEASAARAPEALRAGKQL